MEIKFEDDGKHGKFFVEEHDARVAEMTFTWAGADKFIIDHTEVSDTLRGKGAGKNMVLEAVAYARRENKKILPLCPFAHNIFKRIPEIRDVL